MSTAGLARIQSACYPKGGKVGLTDERFWMGALENPCTGFIPIYGEGPGFEVLLVSSIRLNQAVVLPCMARPQLTLYGTL